MDSTLLTQNGLKKLTVPQLKQMCKENRISGYSKLAKDALIEKLLQWQNGQQPAASAPKSSQQINPLEFTVLPAAPTTRIEHEPRGSVPASQTSAIVSAPESTVTTEHRSMGPPAIPHTISMSSSVTSQAITSSLPPATTMPTVSKRKAPCHDHATPLPKKRLVSKIPGPTITRKPALNSENVTRGSLSVAVSQMPTLTQIGDTPRLVSREPQGITVDQHAGVQNKHPPLKSKPFKALLPASAVRGHSQISSPAAVMFHHRKATHPPKGVKFGTLSGIDSPDGLFAGILSPILLPASISQRKIIPRLAVILSGITIEDLKICSLVSRSFRYAAYLSAKNQLQLRFCGRKLEAFLSKYPSPTTNFWPYLLHRQCETNARRRIYEASFVAYVLGGKCRPSVRVWSNPDHPAQSAVVARFLLTKAFFIVSVGVSAKEECNLETVVDAQEVIPDEIWKIMVHSADTNLTHEYYVLEPTCEVVGHLPVSSEKASNDLNLRADWLFYISNRLRDSASDPGRDPRKTTIFDYLHWSNHEEYEHGISKVWLKRIQSEGSIGESKSTVARRYILASVVANSVSGRWMSYTAMQQDFNGMSSGTAEGQQPKVTKLNLYVPAHHHVESVHFETSKKVPLHSSIAAVQTPGREYYVLRDSGMQIGCEEEGIAAVWLDLLGCDPNGCPIN